jgi:hypothetical protein
VTKDFSSTSGEAQEREKGKMEREKESNNA